MGVMEPARTYIMEAMQAGKQVVTANKDLTRLMERTDGSAKSAT